MDTGTWLTTDEVAQRLRMRGGTRGVTRLVRRGDLAAVRVGREYRINETAIAAYLQQRIVRP